MRSTPLTRSEGMRLLRLVRDTIACRLGLIKEVDPDGLEEAALQQELATFVTLKKRGELRGCIGNLEPAGSLVDSLARNAVNAAFHDIRFAPLSAAEFEQVTVELSILSEPRPLDYRDGDDLLEQLHPGRHGVILESGRARATFLPQVWQQLPEPRDFLSHLCRKAGLSPSAWQRHPDIWVYEVQHFEEEDR